MLPIVERYLIQRLKKIFYFFRVRMARKVEKKHWDVKIYKMKGLIIFCDLLYILSFCNKVNITAENQQANSTNRQPLNLLSTPRQLRLFVYKN